MIYIVAPELEIANLIREGLNKDMSEVRYLLADQFWKWPDDWLFNPAQDKLYWAQPIQNSGQWEWPWDNSRPPNIIADFFVELHHRGFNKLQATIL
jgi:hypothetical protein